MIYGYIRVSTDRQTTKNQKFEIDKFCKTEKMKIDKWIMETISSTQELQKRKLGRLLNKLGENDILITAEISRLGRNLLQIMSILHYCMSRGVQVWTIKDNYRLGTDIQSKVLAFAFGLSAEIERNLISQRTKEAMARLASEGKLIGRPLGPSNNKLSLEKHHEKIVSMRQKRVPMYQIAQLLGCNRKTVSCYIQYKRQFKDSLNNDEQEIDENIINSTENDNENNEDYCEIINA